MKLIKILAILFFALGLYNQVNAANETYKKKTKTAEMVFAFANEMEFFDKDVLKAEMKDLSVSERGKLIKMAIADVKQAQLAGPDQASVGMYILAVLFPPLAVCIQTNCGMPTLFNVLWTCLGYFPGVIHAFIILGR